MRKTLMKRTVIISTLLISISAFSATPDKLISDSSIPGGICLILGDEDGSAAVEAGRNERFTVQALYTNQEQLQNARRTIQETGLQGRVSATLFNGKQLPYTDNLINVAVASGEWQMTSEEIMRMLTPGGVAYVNGTKKVKTWPEEIDQWTHFLHGPDGNPVAKDNRAGPPKHYQWQSGPKWAQSHETDTNFRCLITANGRLYYLVNLAPTSMAGPDSPPDKWALQSRDAFNGVLLWSHPVKEWGWRQWKPTWFTPRPGVIPLNLDKRIAANGDKLYFTLGYRAPVSELDGKTGKILRTFKSTERSSELLCTGDSLVITVMDKEKGAIVKRLDLDSGKILWSSENSYAGTTVDYYRFTAMYGKVEEAKVDPTLDLAVDGNTIALVDGDSVVALDYKTGKQRWRSKFPLAEGDLNAGRINNTAGMVWNGAMIVSDSVVLHASPNNLAAFSAETGDLLWQQPKKYLQHLWYEWQDVFVINGLVWTWSDKLAKEKLAGFKGASSWPESVNGYDIKSGELKKSVPLGKTFKTHHHHRCYRNKATSKYILSSRRGSEYVNLEGGEHSINNWVRGACHMGMMPANGMQYAPPHPCQCYANEMINGLNALTPANDGQTLEALRRNAAPRLIKGPAFSSSTPGPSCGIGDWPLFRGNAQRSGSTQSSLSGNLKNAWQIKAGIKVSAPVAVGDSLFVSLIDQHQILALSTETGKELWRFTAGGRIDSAPTYDRGSLIFGSTDGRAYRIRADNGELIWSLRGGPADLRMSGEGQLESVWPICGSVLINEGIAYFAAGRSSHLDGGIRLIAADAATGSILHENTLTGPEYDGNEIEQNLRLPMGWIADMFFKELDYICMHRNRFNKEMKLQKGMPSLKVGAGFLDDTWFKRKPWSIGTSGFARSLVFDDKNAYCLRMFESLRGLDPKVYFTPGSQGYTLYAKPIKKGERIWERRISIRGKALALSSHALCVAGPPDVIPEDDPLAAFEGRLGGVLHMINKSDGSTVAEYQLDSPPIFNGAAIAGNRLFLSLEDGSVICFSE